MGVVLWAVAALLLGLSSVLDAVLPESLASAFLGRIVFAGGVVAVVVAVVYSARTWIASVLRARLDVMVGSTVVKSMPPRDVLESLLSRIYPPQMDHQEMITWILGAAGRDAEGGDTIVSYDTTVHYRVEPVDDVSSTTYMTCTYRYEGVRNNFLFVIFATSSRNIARLIAHERVYPLYETWTVEEEDLDVYAPNLQSNIRVGIRYVNDTGCEHVVEPTSVPVKEVESRFYDRYIRISPQIDPLDIRIFVLDLHELVDDHYVETINEVTLHSSNVSNVDLGYVVWTPPHPCHVTEVSFDLAALREVRGADLVHQVVTSGLGGAGMAHRGWLPVEDTIRVRVDSWMLPGHNITLLYRPESKGEESDATGLARDS